MTWVALPKSSGKNCAPTIPTALARHIEMALAIPMVLAETQRHCLNLPSRVRRGNNGRNVTAFYQRLLTRTENRSELRRSLGTPPIDVRFMGVTLAQVRAVLVWLMFASSFYVAIEPAPADLLFLVVLACFLGSGLTLSAVLVPLILFLLLYNLGGFFSFLQVAGDEKARMFVITSFYMASSAVFFAFYVANNPVRRMAIIRNALIIASAIASSLGVLGYFNVAGLGPEFSLYWRAVGTFKDPNVFATYLLFPGVMLVQGFLLGTQRHKFISMIGLFIILAALFLAFSRGAWISFLFATALMVTLTFILTPAAGTRSRIILITLFGLVGLAVLIAMLLSVEGIRDLFLDRFTFAKDYDSGKRAASEISSTASPLARAATRVRAPLFPQDLRTGSAQRLHQCLRLLWLAWRHFISAADDQHDHRRIQDSPDADAVAELGNRVCSAPCSQPSSRA